MRRSVRTPAKGCPTDTQVVQMYVNRPMETFAIRRFAYIPAACGTDGVCMRPGPTARPPSSVSSPDAAMTPERSWPVPGDDPPHSHAACLRLHLGPVLGPARVEAARPVQTPV